VVTFDYILNKCPPLKELYYNENRFEDLLKIVNLQTNIEEYIRKIVKEHYLSPKSTVENYVTIKPPVIILDRTKILAGAYLEGPAVIGEDCVIGPNCHIRKNSIILNKIMIGQGAEIKETILLDGCKISHFSYIGNSFFGKNVNIGGGSLTAVRRFDNQNIKLKLQEKFFDTKRYKFGAIIGDNVQLGVGVLIYPGRVIKPNTTIKPGTIVKQNII